MKNILIIIAFVLIGTTVKAQEFSKIDKSAMDRSYYPAKAPHRTFEKDVNKKKGLVPQIRVTYSRPAKKGREVFGTLLKFGEAWRVGANESTEILFLMMLFLEEKK